MLCTGSMSELLLSRFARKIGRVQKTISPSERNDPCVIPLLKTRVYFLLFSALGLQIGMVAWKMTLKTPEYPEGRDIIVIGNDITYRIGSFGPREDLLFLRASELARAEGIPRIYVAANSGARIGLAEEIRHMFHVAWEDPDNPYKVRGHRKQQGNCNTHRSLILTPPLLTEGRVSICQTVTSKVFLGIGSGTLEVFKAKLGGAWSSLVLSKPNHSMIGFYDLPGSRLASRS